MCSWALDMALSEAGWLPWPPLSLLDWGRLGMGSRSPSQAVVAMVLRDSFLGLAGTPKPFLGENWNQPCPTSCTNQLWGWH